LKRSTTEDARASWKKALAALFRLLAPGKELKKDETQFTKFSSEAILCNADATVEVPLVDKNGDPVVDGMVMRECNDWKALWDASMNSERISDLQ
jgi:hypothetical protein